MKKTKFPGGEAYGTAIPRITVREKIFRGTEKHLKDFSRDILVNLINGAVLYRFVLKMR